MFKRFRRLLGLAVLLLLAAVIFLVPSSVKQSEQLKNVQGEASWTSIIESTLSNANVSAQGVISTEVSLDNTQLNRILKTSLADSQSQELLDSAYSIKDDKLRVQYPMKLAFVDSKVDLEMSVTAADNVLHLAIDSAKLGAFPIPRALVISMLKQQLAEKNSAIATEGDSFLYSLPVSRFSIDKISLEDSQAKIQFSMNYSSF